MRSSLISLGAHRNKPTVSIIVILILVLILLTGTLAGCSKKTATPTVSPTAPPSTPTATPPPQPQPPALVETDPLQGTQIGLQEPITLYFNQPMDRASVEAALTGEPKLSGSYAWQDDSSLTFTPDEPLLPGSTQTISIATTAQSAKGLSLLQPIEVEYTMIGYLNLSQSLPTDGATDVNPTSALVANFNQPVVALGADPSSLPVGFSLQPPAEGSGEWVNTSTYIFHPNPGLSGGTSYQVKINPDLTSTRGAPMESKPEWSFSTTMPRLVSTIPADNTYFIHLDTNVQLNFSYAMDADSVEENFTLQAGDSTPVSGQYGWNDDFTTLTFTPTALLQRDTMYTVSVGAEAAAMGGTPLGESINFTWNTVPELTIYGTEPSEGGIKENYTSVRIFLSSLINNENISEYFSFKPEVPNIGTWLDEEQLVLNFYGDFSPERSYTLTISPELTDLWGSRLGETFTLNFRTAQLEPSIQFPYSTDAVFLTTQDDGVLAQVTNMTSIPVSVGSMTVDDLARMYSDSGYEFRQNFYPADAESWTFYPEVPRNESTTVTIPIAPDGQPLQPGLYFLRLDIPGQYGYVDTMILAVSHYQTTLKLSPSEAFVWAVDFNTNTPAPDMPVTVYDDAGEVLAEGITDKDGVFQGPSISSPDPYNASFAMLGQPGDDNFGFAMAFWDDGISPWNFDIPTSYYPSKYIAYVYTDRPIYRPGDTVHFRLVLRQVENGRYSLPDVSSYVLQLMDPLYNTLANYDIQLNGFGTAHGEYKLSSGAIPGTYSLINPDEYAGVYFDVADYRKPEINLQVAFQDTDVLSGTALLADINARYFFDAPAGNLPIQWVLYRKDASFHIPNYQVGPVDTSWLNAYNYYFGTVELGEPVEEGNGKTDANGMLSLELSAPAMPGRQQYTLEATITDESGLPTSARSAIFVNPAEYYIGIHPDAWSYQAESEAGFDVLVADWEGNPAGARELSAEFQRVEWVRIDPSPDTMGYMFPTYEPVYTFIDSTSISTDADGKARVDFIPPEPGTFQLDVSGDGTLTQVIIWVGGEGQAIWPSLPNQRLRLVPDKDTYQPGDTAQIFVPNPFGSQALGLLTVERGTVMRYQTIELEPGGTTIPVALSQEDAPNVVIAVTLLGQDEQGNPDFRQGYVNLSVDASFEYLTIEFTSQPERTGPGETVSLSIRVSDADGNPVKGEFSLSVVDRAVLALSDPNAEDIYATFYGQQPVSVRTGISLAGSGQRLRYMPGGMGGGGGMEAKSVTRENFPDTAYWNAEIVTDDNGEATVDINLPDTLTTWQVLLRGLTHDTLVGEKELDVITTKDLLVRPVTPRFLVAGDHALLAAVVQNNTGNPLQGKVTLQAAGFELDDPNSATQAVSVDAHGRTRVEWWGTVPYMASANLLFSVQAGELQDSVRVSKGALPILHYTAPQTFATSGTLPDAGERLELVSLPVTFDASSGSLDVELDPSMAAAMLDTLKALEDYSYDCTEPILSSFLPNLVTYSTLRSFGIDSPELKASLDSALDQGLTHLLSLQRTDGGWSWCQEPESDSFITAYVLYGLATAREAGIIIPDDAITNARNYITSSLFTPSRTSQTWELDRLAFENYALAVSGPGNQTSANKLFAVRDQLSPWAVALLALTMDSFQSANEQVSTLLSDLQATAIRSATGVHWEAETMDWQNMTTTLSNSAIVLYTLAQLEQSSTLIPDAVNFLMSNRQADGCWYSSYEDTWILLAMDEVMKTTGELSSDYAFNASLNGSEIAAGQAGGSTQLNPVAASLPISDLYPQDPNALVIQRDPGPGRLYYTAALNISRPVEDVAPLDQGISVARAYFIPGADLETATPVSATQVGEMLTTRLTIVLPTDVYHFVVEDYIPAGTEILNSSLKTTQQGENSEIGPLYDPEDPFSQGWGWWLFDQAQIYDDHITWTASYLPAGTYELVYTLVILQEGEYHVLPAHAWMLYFPEVQGNSAGALLEIKP